MATSVARPVMTIGFVLISVSILFGQTKSERKQDKAPSTWTIDKCVNEFSKDKVQKTDAGYQYWFVDKDLADGKTLKLSVVKPHAATHAPHKHAEDEFFFILEGKVELTLNGERKVVGPFSSLYCPPNVEHGIRNVGDTEAKYLVVKKYDKQ